MEDLVIFLLSFVVIFIVYLIIYFIRRKKGTLYKMKEFELLMGKFRLKKKDLNFERLALVFALINSLIISITGTVSTMNDFGYIWELAIAFVMLMGLIYVSYTLLGRYLVKKKEGERK